MDLKPFLGEPSSSVVDGDSSLLCYQGKPACLVMSLRGAVYSGPLAKYCVTTAYEALQRAFPGGGPYTFIHDFSELRDYDSEARKVLLDFGRKLGNSGRSIMCLSMELRPLLRIGISTATALVASLGLHVETTNDSPLQVLKRVGFTPLIRS